MNSLEQKPEGGEPKKKKDKKSSEELLQLHENGKHPIRSGKKTFCAYSLDEPIPPCPLNHRGSGKEYLVNGVRRILFRCLDSRLKDLPESDYNYLEVIEIEGEKK